MSVTIVAPCRLHFGLFHVPVEGLSHWPDGTPVRKFGGLGMMIAGPQITVTATADRQFSASGSLGARAVEFAKLLPTAVPSKIVANGPSEHIGLGVGTALAMTTGRALIGHAYQDNLPLFFGRGKRSGIGIRGFHQGGFIVDDGKLDDELADIRERIEVPELWRVILIRPAVPGAWHGEPERTAFRRGRSAEAALDTTRRLLQLANASIIPALKRADFDTFVSSLTDFNRIAGEPFNDDQGGPYAGPAVTGIIDELLEWGVRGVGQSSWGPTVFAFAREEAEAQSFASRLRTRFPNLAEVRVTAADNRGVREIS